MGWKRIELMRRPAAGEEARERASFLYSILTDTLQLVYTNKEKLVETNFCAKLKWTEGDKTECWKDN